MSGGNLNFDYNRDLTYGSAHCISYDVVDIFSILSDIMIEPKS